MMLGRQSLKVGTLDYLLVTQSSSCTKLSEGPVTLRVSSLLSRSFSYLHAESTLITTSISNTPFLSNKLGTCILFQTIPNLY